MSATRLVGVYSFFHDGWQGTLSLEQEGEGRLRARYESLRFARRFEGWATVATAEPQHFELVLHRFNEAPRQVFDGYLFGARDEFLAGVTEWRDKPFGFFGRKSVPRCLSRYGQANDRLSRNDFFGTWTIWHRDVIGDLEIRPGARGLVAWYTDERHQGIAVPIESGGANDHELAFELPGDGVPGRAKGYLFTRPKNGAAGTVRWGERVSGFFMTKYRGPRL